MRLLVTGGTGFVGSNVVKVAIERHQAQVTVTAHTWRPSGKEPFEVVSVDMTDTTSLRNAVREARPDAIIHSAILNDFPLMYANRALAWDSYVTSTQTLVDAANEIDAKLVLVSTDWVFDGTQSAAAETTPPISTACSRSSAKRSSPTPPPTGQSPESPASTEPIGCEPTTSRRRIQAWVISPAPSLMPCGTGDLLRFGRGRRIWSPPPVWRAKVLR